jgi:hypothetical protein
MYQYITKCKYTLKMIQIIVKLDEYLIIYWIWVDYTILVPYEKLHFCDFTKNYLDKIFHSNKHKCVEKQIC